MAEYKLSYTAAEIDKKLNEIDNLSNSINSIPTKTSELINDSNFLNSENIYVEAGDDINSFGAPTINKVVSDNGDITFVFNYLKGEAGKDGNSITSITTDENNNVIVTFSDGTEQNIGQLHVDVQADFLTSGGFGNLRFTDNKFQYYNEATSQWVDTQMTSDNVTILNLSPQPMQTFATNYNPDTGNVELYINESADTIIGGQTASTVEKVIIRRKKDTFPIDENDGDLILITERKNFGAYKRVPYIDVIENVQMGETYCYKAFPINNVGFVGYSASNESKFTTKDYWLFGFVLDQNESDPASMIRYIEDNEGYQSAYMDYDTNKFNYGSWENAWFMKVKPCMLNYDGTVAYYLNPNDYSLKEDGTASDIADETFEGNAMVGIPKTYWKIVDNGDDTANIYFSNKKVDDNFHCWSHIDNNGNEIDYCYMPIYNGSNINNMLRSISGKAPIGSQTVTNEITYAKANNQDNDMIWYTETYADRTLINILLLLIGKSTDTQTVFGNGHYIGGSNASHLLTSGTLNNKGLFYGTNGTGTGVKVFGIENWWGNVWRRLAGWICDKGIHKVKLTYGQSDGSTTNGYNTDGNGYIALNTSVINGVSGNNGGFINKMIFTNNGIAPISAYGSSTTYYADNMWINNAACTYAIVGCSCDGGFSTGAFAISAKETIGSTYFGYNSSISCKPLALIEEVE